MSSMLISQLTALAFLALSAAFLFGPRIAVYGTQAIRDMARDGQAQFVGGCLISAIVLVFTAPHLSYAFASGGNAVSLVIIDLFTMNFGTV